MCEMLVWQWTELGDGKEREFREAGCHFNSTRKNAQGDARKMHTWDAGEMPAAVFETTFIGSEPEVEDDSMNKFVEL